MPVSFQFESYAFFFDLLALSLLLLPCYLLARKPCYRRIVMTLGGIYLVYFIAPRMVPFYLAFWTLVFAAHRTAFGETSSGWRKSWLIGLASVAVAAIILPMISWKIAPADFIGFFTRYANLTLRCVSTKIWEIDMIKPILAPVGLSFATFRAADLLIKTYLGKLRDLSYGEVLFYGFFPPVQTVGPIIEFEEIARQDPDPTPADVLDSLMRVASGIFKIFVLAGLLQYNGKMFDAPHSLPPWQLAMQLIAYSWFFYLNFSGYSDIAIGTALLYGFRLKENFGFPFFRRNIQEFWASWHMSLTRWAQRNIFVPAGGYRARTQYRALFLTMMGIALWHNLNLSMTLFGLYHFVLQALYRWYAAHAPRFPKGIQRIPAPLRAAGPICLTYIAVLLSFPLIVLDWDKAAEFYKALVGL